jgi:hypothetical protein
MMVHGSIRSCTCGDTVGASNVDVSTVWVIATQRLTPLKKTLHQMLADLEQASGPEA